jgi:hypothetical protein
MKNLENIPKKNIYEVPEGYFDKLPGIIQARIATEAPEVRKNLFLTYSVRFALPALLIGVVAYLFWPNAQPSSAEELLAGIETPYLVDYLEEVSIGEDVMVENDDLTETDVAEIEGLIYFGSDDQTSGDEEFLEELKKDFILD